MHIGKQFKPKIGELNVVLETKAAEEKTGE